jgi:hypothetical protein
METYFITRVPEASQDLGRGANDLQIQWGLEKFAAAIYEAIAITKIEAWYALRQIRVHARYNEVNALPNARSSKSRIASVLGDF